MPRDKQARTLALIFLLFSLAILTTGLVSYGQQAAHLKRVHLDEMEAVAELKVGIITEWLAERRANVASASGNPTIATALAQWKHNGDKTAEEHLLGFLHNFRESYDFASAELLDLDGTRLLGAGDVMPQMSEMRQFAKEAVDTGAVRMVDLHLHKEDGSIRLGHVAPIFVATDTDRRAIGVLFVGLRAESHLYPHIRRWPRPSATGELVLVRREGNEIAFLNPLRHHSDTAFHLRWQVATEELPAAIAIRAGAQPVSMTGIDYRGVRTLFVGRAVPGTSWILIAKMDEAEALAELNQLALTTGGIMALTLAATLAFLSTLWHRQRLTAAEAEATLSRALKASEERYRIFFQNSRLPNLLIDPADGRIIDANKAASTYYGYDIDQLRTMKITAINTLAPEDIRAEMERARSENRNHFNFRHRLASGEIRDVEVYSGPLDIDSQRLLYSIIIDVTDRKRMERELEEMATTDALTGLPNRRHFLTRLEEQLARLDRAVTPCASVMMLDLDHFKKINDTYGHAAGDAVLRHVAKLMRDNIRKIDIPGRIGGEEFAILLPGIGPAEARVTAERLRETIAATPVALDDGESLLLTISIGISEILPTDNRIDAPLTRADAALYRAKESGRNRTVVAEEMG
ncbi:diguanylate cyclase [Sulfurivermis fontis]|uniref:sensor domain-containing diguanylate cyclase n=1 Tax=Sulfurivermis fontis TaxID=1972068 RepID=UPI000FDC807F|nr:diguanylate cyclase [Sulfurivermis fontis]